LQNGPTVIAEAMAFSERILYLKYFKFNILEMHRPEPK